MLHALRHCLVLLLMLTLPLQGVSAALMAGMPMHEHEASAQTSAAEDCHGHGAQAMQDNDTSARQGMPGKPAPMKTKACGSCCSGLMASVSASLHPVAHLAGRQLIPDALTPEGIIPDSLERPPRQFS